MQPKQPKNIYELIYMSLQLLVPTATVFGVIMVMLRLQASNFDYTEWTAGGSTAGAVLAALFAAQRAGFGFTRLKKDD